MLSLTRSQRPIPLRPSSTFGKEDPSSCRILAKGNSRQLTAPVAPPNQLIVSINSIFAGTSRAEVDVEMDENNNKDSGARSTEDSFRQVEEEADLKKCMEECKIQDVVASTEKLSKTEELRTQVKPDRNLVRSFKDSVFQKKEKSQPQITEKNKGEPRVELQALPNQLYSDRKNESSLMNSHLASKNDIQICLNPARALDVTISTSMDPVCGMICGAVEQHIRQLELNMGNQVANHIITVLNCLVTEYDKKIAHLVHNPDVVLPNHSEFYYNLMPYSGLLKWCKKNHRTSFDRVLEQYAIIVKAQYKRSIELFFEFIETEHSSNGRMTIGSHGETASVANWVASGLFRLFSFLCLSDKADTIRPDSSICLSEWEEFEESSEPSKISINECEQLASLVDRVLSAIESLYLSEQKFCVKFFDLPETSSPKLIVSPQPKSHQRKDLRSSPVESISRSTSNLSQDSFEAVFDSKKCEELDNLMSELFQSLEIELDKFICRYNLPNSIFSIYLLARLTQHLISVHNAQSLLVNVYYKIMIPVNENFDLYMETQQRAIVEAKVPKRVKCGVFPFVSKFEALAKQIELLFRAPGTQRADIDRWYCLLVQSMFESIDRLSIEHPITPGEMVRIENYYALYDILLKIPCLKQERNAAKTKYKEAVKEYVQRYFGRPLEKLSAFFEGVQAKVVQGVREESCQMNFNDWDPKNKLARLVNDCSLKVIKKELERIYMDLESNAFNPESPLIQKIWRSMQEEFATEYKAIQNMIHKCYSDASITLTFTLEEMLNVFAEIALSR